MGKYPILIVHKDHPIDLAGVNSGAETATLWLARFLARAGERVVVAAQLRGGDERKWGVEFWDLGPRYDTPGVIERARSLGPYRILAACRALVLQLAAREELCVSRHFIAHDPSSGALGISPRVLAELADGIICVSEAQKQLFVKEGIPDGRITVIPNGADHSVFRARGERDFSKIVFAGALVTDKGVDILIRAFQHVRAACPEASLDIFGSSAMWGRAPLFDERDVERGVPGIKFHGSVPQERVAEALSSSGICVIPSRWFDSFPLAAVEAQASGCPVVAFDVGGIRESIVAGETGVLVPEVSDEALARALVALLRDKARLAAMSKRAVEVARERFTWERVASQVTALIESAGRAPAAGAESRRLGVLSTWNQECGLATYARFLFSELPPGSFTVFSEAGAKLTAPDEPFVERCWRRSDTDFGALEKAIERRGISALHVNLHSAKFFQGSAFTAFLAALRKKGVRVLVHLHSTFTLDAAMRSVLTNADRVIVNSGQNRLEAIANGADPGRTAVLPHGVHRRPALSERERAQLRSRLGIDESCKSIAAFGFVQPHKGMEGVIEAVAHLASRGAAANGFILGAPMPGDPASAEYARQLREFASKLGVADKVRFSERFLTEEEVGEWLRAVDLVLMNYRSQHYEASGACSIAVGAGAVVAASIAPPFVPFGDAVWHVTAGYPAALTAQLLLENGELCGAVRANARRYAEANDWPVVARKLLDIYRTEGFQPEISSLEEKTVEHSSDARSRSSRPLKVLMQNRSTTLTARGGDTVVIEKTAAGLRSRGHDVTVDVEGREDPGRYDIVHLFNFALPDMVRSFGERAKQAGVPFVVTTLCEDVPVFHTQSHALTSALLEYVARGQNRSWWQASRPNLAAVPPAARFMNDWTVEHAAALLTNGSRETATIRRDYPRAGKIVEVMLGREVGASGSAEAFVREYGISDFILCVGRLESRKNQLMLLKALEDSDLPIVLAGGGFTYQPEYAEAVRKFRRAGKTLILDRLSPEMLAAAYEACRVHVLPSWYELPGLVSLEAAFHRRNVVATDCGTTRDYLGDHAFYCSPADENSIQNAVLAAYYSPVKPGLAESVQRFTWDGAAQRTLEVYEEVLERTGRRAPAESAVSAPAPQSAWTRPTPQPAYDAAPGLTEFQDLLERGEMAARGREFERAHELLGKAEALNPESMRLCKARGAVFLAENKIDDAQRYFERAQRLDPREPKVWNGLGMCEMRRGRSEAAFKCFKEALAVFPEDTISIMNLIPCAYDLGRFEELEQVLARYVANRPDDLEMRYCYAGCLYKLGRADDAGRETESVLRRNPTHRGAKELREILAKEAAAEPAPAAAPIAAPVQPAATVTGGGLSASVTRHNAIDIDAELGRLEEAKRKREYETVRSGLDAVMSQSGLSAAQREHATLLRAELSVMRGELDDARATFASVLASNPRSARALCGTAVLAANENRWTEAERLFDEALRIRPNYDVALAGLGLCAWQKGDHEGAWEKYRGALTVNPENGRALLGAMQVGYPLKKHGEIEALLRAYLDVHPADLEFVYSLAGCCFAQNKLDEAIEQVNKITLFRPDDSRARELKRMIDERMQSA